MSEAEPKVTLLMIKRLAATLAFLILTVSPAASKPNMIWTASWAAPPAPPLASAPGFPDSALAHAFKNQTITQVVRLSAGGSALRLRLTNEYGAKPLKIGAARVDLVDDKGEVVPGTDRVVTFGGHGDAVVPAGAPWLSDVLQLTVPARARLKISLYFPEDTGLCTCHAVGGGTAAVSPSGDFTAAAFKPAMTLTARAFISGVDVVSSSPRPVVVAFGDSITDGYLSTIDKDQRWPDRLAERLSADKRYHRFGVANASLSGNRILTDGSIALFGQSAVGRFDRDVLSIPGVSTIIMLEGVNDIGQKRDIPMTADALIEGYRQIIARAHAKGIKIIGGTLLPYEGAAYYRSEGDAVRNGVNRWIRSSGEFDGVVDFDKAMRDPQRPSRIRAELQSGDWLHPNDAGYRVMGDTIVLSELK